MCYSLVAKCLRIVPWWLSRRFAIMARTKGSKNKPKDLKKVSKKLRKYKKFKCNGDIMANINDILTAVNNLNGAVDTLITNIGNINTQGGDTQPAIDAVNVITAKIQAIQLPTA
jgi:hypothetical protein